ncbi:terminase [Streptomyces phage Comrade]|uniref:Terminase n=3 Tax=Gilsonvirus comrade TaxID=2846395 RepID=A0A345ME19_9CAUD|nr:terminase [Streptomyces phage Comrade]AXH68800.1 terminase [Streptomyces phage SparkleGoddess]AXQ63358.1 terminase [Streptomyces phage Comrade]QQO39775.1 terminase [Streptomyces phage Belfort]UTN92342.1 terminase [Streptomyces phage Stigma]
MSNFDFNELLNMLDGEDFEQRPVSIEEFVQSEDYLNLPPLSENQYKLIKASSQIYKKSTLAALYGEEAAEKRFAETMNEVIFQLGKGSGKGYTSSIACAYIVYLLLCLKDPAKYYGKPPGDHIAILNIAINAAQAQNVFFKYFKQRITSSPWFVGKYTEKSGEFQFDKNIFVYSGHSEREAWEGYNVIFVILDEISGFALDSTSGNEQAKTASAVYKMYKQSVTSRFPEFGKVVLLSFPRFKNDFIQQRYADVIAEKEVIIRSHRFKVDPALPDGTEGNEFEIEWEEDQIISYRIPKIFALKRPTWEINPLIKLDDLMAAFYDDPIDSLSRFACMPPDAIDAFFKDRAKIELAFSKQSTLNEDNSFRPNFIPDPEKRYYVHVDLARVHDHAAVALAHVEKWEQRNIGGKMTEPAPVVVVDQVRYWTPSKTKNVDFTEIREYILSLKRRGFNIRLVTFDRWESADTMQYLNDRGLKAERLSVAKKHYEDFAMVIAEQRVVGPSIELLIDELLQLRIMKNDRVDHPRKGSKDLSDAVCGAIYNAIAHTPRNLDETVEVKTLESVRKEIRRNSIEEYEQMKNDGVIRPPKRKMPQELEEFLARISTV